jgi:ubiquinol-cytochrome c reductase cytochrome b subunit
MRDQHHLEANRPRPTNGVSEWIDYRLPIFTLLRRELNEYPTPRNRTSLWNFGSLSGIVLVIMIVIGIALAMHYTPTTAGAFDSVEHIMRDVNYGWLIRYVHTTSASMFFAVAYIHIFRGLYYGSYKAARELLWWLGVIILLLMMATGFFGYTLPWGTMNSPATFTTHSGWAQELAPGVDVLGLTGLRRRLG